METSLAESQTDSCFVTRWKKKKKKVSIHWKQFNFYFLRHLKSNMDNIQCVCVYVCVCVCVCVCKTPSLMTNRAFLLAFT